MVFGSGPRRSRTPVVVVAAILSLFLLGLAAYAIGGGFSTRADIPSDGNIATGAPARPSPTRSSAMLAGVESTIAYVNVPDIVVREEPVDSAAVITTLPQFNEHKVQQVFLVKDSMGDWLYVLLPIRPNGSKGWIKRADVRLTGTNLKIKVYLGSRRLELLERGVKMREFPVGVGKGNTPTPGGEYYIKELLRPTQANSPYGAYAYGLSGFSNVLENFAGGPGVIGIHGTNDPSTIGKEVSAGCVRMRNEDISELVAVLPLGTPVEIYDS